MADAIAMCRPAAREGGAVQSCTIAKGTVPLLRHTENCLDPSTSHPTLPSAIAWTLLFYRRERAVGTSNEAAINTIRPAHEIYSSLKSSHLIKFIVGRSGCAMLRPLTSSTQISPIEIDEVNSLLPSVRSIATPNGDGNVNGDNAWGPLLIDASASKNKNGDPRASISLSAHEHNEINYTNGGLTLPVVDHSIATRPIEASEPSGDGASFEMKPAVNDDKQRMKTSATATSSYERDASAHLSGDQRAGPDTMGQVRTESNWQEASSGLKREAELETGGAFPKRCCSQESLELATVVDAQVFIKRASAQPLMTSDQIGDVSAEINSLKMPADHSISPRLSEASKASRDGFSFEEKPPVVDDDQQRIKTSATATPSYERGSSAHRSGDERAASDTMGQVGTDSNGQEVSTGLKREAEPEKGGAYPNRCWSQEPLKLKSVADVQVFIERAAQPLKTSDEMGDITAEINSLAKVQCQVKIPIPGNVVNISFIRMMEITHIKRLKMAARFETRAS